MMPIRLLSVPRFRRLALLAAVLGLLAGASAPASACSCTEPPDVATCVAQARAVFLGTATSIEADTEGSFPIFRVTFAVSKSWKGHVGPTVEIVTSGSSAACGYDFVVGSDYVVYASLWPDSVTPLRTSLCSRTHATFEGDPEIPLLGTPSLPTTWGALKAGYR